MATSSLIETSRLFIEPFSEKHLTENYINWLNDSDVMKYSEQRHLHHTLDSCRKYFDSFKNTPHYFWAIILKETNIHIGNLNAYVDLNNGLADVGILLGEKKIWRQGFGLEAWMVICKYLLEKGLRKISAGTLALNKGMINIMKQSGMIEDGYRSRHYLVDGQESDILHFALFAKSELLSRS